MATVPTMRTWVTGEVVTAAEMNSNIRDAGNFLLGGSSGRKPVLRLGLSANASIPNNAATTVVWGSVVEDTDSGYNSGTGVYTIQTGGLWLFTGAMFWAGNGTGYRAIAFTIQGGSFLEHFVAASTDPGSAGRTMAAGMVQTAASQTVTMNVTQTSGGALNLLTSESYFAGVWLSV